MKAEQTADKGGRGVPETTMQHGQGDKKGDGEMNHAPRTEKVPLGRQFILG